MATCQPCFLGDICLYSYLGEMNMDVDLDINPADLQFFDGFGLDLDFINF